MSRPALICPKCGNEMNHHADKLVAPTSEREAALVDSRLDGVIQEAHACPGCGHIELRIAADQS